MKQNNTKKLVYSALFLALALVLPFLTGQIQTFGQMLAPMHLPVLLCGFVCGPVWGLAVGAVAPLLRSLLFGMPPMFPTAVAMAFELAAYGLFTGLLPPVFSQAHRQHRQKMGRAVCLAGAQHAAGPRGVGLRDVPFDGRVRRRLRHGGLCGGRFQLGLAGHSGAAGGRAAHCICAGARRPCRAQLRPKPF